MTSNPSIAPFLMALAAAGLIGGALSAGVLRPVEPLRRAPAVVATPGAGDPGAAIGDEAGSDRDAAYPAARDREPPAVKRAADPDPDPEPAQPRILGAAELNPAAAPVIYLGARKIEEEVAHRWSLGKGEGDITLMAPPGALFGGRDPADPRSGERLSFKGQPGPTIIALGSNQCVPCLKELGELVRELGEPLQASKVRVMLVLMTLDGHGYISYQLARQRDLFFATYNKDYRGDAAELPIPDWMVFPQDAKDHWFTFTDQVIDAMSGEDLDVSLPVTLLLDACGNVHRAVLGRLHGEALVRLRADAAALAKASCPP